MTSWGCRPRSPKTSEYALNTVKNVVAEWPARAIIASRISTSSEERCRSSGAIALRPSDNVAVLEERDLAGEDARTGLKWRICEPGRAVKFNPTLQAWGLSFEACRVCLFLFRKCSFSIRQHQRRMMRPREKCARSPIKCCFSVNGTSDPLWTGFLCFPWLYSQ